MARPSALALTIIAGCMASPPRTPPTHDPALSVSANHTRVTATDSVTFTARIRPDLASTMRDSLPADDYEIVPHVIGWHWIMDVDLPDGSDPWTQACKGRALTCTIMVHGSGTMVFSIRTRDRLCAASVHIEAVLPPDVDETTAAPRLRRDSIEAGLTTKIPAWPPCDA